MRGQRLVVLVSATLISIAGLVTGAQPAASAPSGPPLSVPSSQLAASLHCNGDLDGASATPVLLVPGTTLTAAANFSWNYEQVFTAARRPWCAVTLPGHAMGDAQIAAEYVVHGIRAMHARAGRAVSVVGFSQGGMLPRWALKFWPDTRAMVDDVIGLDPSNHGTLDAYAVCAIDGCSPAFWQQQTGSRFLAALNSEQETYAGISYTQIYTATDEVVVPNFPPAASSALHTGPGAIANILVQSICPVHVSEHLTMGTIDPVGYALVLDALTHAGPAVRSRIPKSVCLELMMPGLKPLSVLTGVARMGVMVGTQIVGYPHVSVEPPLAGYAAN